jgi:hypothetical protein
MSGFGQSLGGAGGAGDAGGVGGARGAGFLGLALAAATGFLALGVEPLEALGLGGMVEAARPITHTGLPKKMQVDGWRLVVHCLCSDDHDRTLRRDVVDRRD